MNGLWVFAFVVLPVLVVAMGWTAVRLHERALDRELDRRETADGKPAG
jgi:uncharacterized membrane protein